MMLRRGLAQTVCALGALLVTGCAGGPFGDMFTYSENYDGYDPSFFAYAGGGRDTRVVIRGNPLPVSQTVFEQAVIDAMQGENYPPATNFTTTPQNTARNFYVVVLFNAPVGQSNQAMCGDPAALTPEPPDTRPIRVATAFCGSDAVLSRVKGQVSDLAGVQDPRLDRLMAQIVRRLLPPENPDRRNDDDSGGSFSS